ncbi:MAG: hypothetical protein WAO81_08220, partial [Methanosarcina flavescens]
MMGDALEKILTSETFQQEIESNQGTMKQVFKFFKLVFPLYLKGIPVIINNLFFLDPSGIIERATTPVEPIIYKHGNYIMQVSGTERII